MTLRALALTVLVLSPASASAQEWQVKPFLGLTFRGATTFVDPDDAAGDTHLAIGGSVTRLGEMIGLEADFGFVPGFFTGDQRGGFVSGSGVTTLTGNVVIALPRRMTQYTLRPYIAGGLGLMRVRKDDVLAGPLTRHLMTIDFGGGATGFVTDTVGLSWDLRYFRNITGAPDPDNPGQSFGAPRLSFWRATMGVVLR
ncbi:MAG: hypothetical protein ACRD2A_01485 [Vicinamibacterales bacterium]